MEQKQKNMVFISRCVRYVPYFLLLLFAVFVITHCRLVVTEGSSMEPTYYSGDILLCVRSPSSPATGDVVLIELDGRMVVKRVTHVAGDAVSDIWFYQTEDGYAGDSSGVMYWGSNVVPNGYVFVEGDNVANSHDSRYEDFGLVPIENIWGRVALGG